MLWEQKLQASVFTAFPSYPKGSQVHVFRYKHTEHVFYFSQKTKENNLFTLIIKMSILCLHYGYMYVNSSCQFCVSKNMIID